MFFFSLKNNLKILLQQAQSEGEKIEFHGNEFDYMRRLMPVVRFPYFCGGLLTAEIEVCRKSYIVYLRHLSFCGDGAK